MNVECKTCGSVYDDADCWTICPHGPLWASVNAYCRICDLVDCERHYTGRFAVKMTQEDLPVTMADRLNTLSLEMRRFGWLFVQSIGIVKLLEWMQRVFNPQPVEESPFGPNYPNGCFDARAWAEEFCRVTKFKDADWAHTWFANAIMTGYDHGRTSERKKRSMIRLWNVQTGAERLVTPGDDYTGINETPRVFLERGSYEVEFYDRANLSERADDDRPTLDAAGPGSRPAESRMAHASLEPNQVAAATDAARLHSDDAPERPAHRDRGTDSGRNGMASGLPR